MQSLVRWVFDCIVKEVGPCPLSILSLMSTLLIPRAAACHLRGCFSYPLLVSQSFGYIHTPFLGINNLKLYLHKNTGRVRVEGKGFFITLMMDRFYVEKWRDAIMMMATTCKGYVGYHPETETDLCIIDIFRLWKTGRLARWLDIILSYSYFSHFLSEIYFLPKNKNK